MNIAIYFLRGNYGGGERVLRKLTKEFESHGINVFGFSWNQEIKNNDPNSKIEILNYSGTSNKLASYYAKYTSLKSFFRKYSIDLVINFGFDVVITHAAKTVGVKTLTSLRVGVESLSPKLKNKLYRKIIFRLSTGIVFQTDDIRKCYPPKIRNKSIVIPNLILDELPPPSPHRYQKIVAIGRLYPEKDFETLLTAFSLIKNPGYDLHIYGDGILRRQLESFAKKLGISEHVIFEGKVNRVVQHIADAEIFILSSLSEGMPNALIEAMSMGLACISTNFPSGAAKQLISHRKNGLLVPVGDAVELSHCLQQLIDDKPLRKRLQKSALTTRDTLDSKIIIPIWIEYINKLVTA